MAWRRGQGLAAVLMVAVLATAACSGGGDEPSAAGAAGSSSPAASSSAADPRLAIPEPSPPPYATKVTAKERDAYLRYAADAYVWAINTGFSAHLLKVFPGGEETPTDELISDVDRIRTDGLVVESSPLTMSQLECMPPTRRDGLTVWVCRWVWTADSIVVTTAEGESQSHEQVRSEVTAAILLTKGANPRIEDWRATGDLPSAVIP
ncbi:MAG: hypothetical protein KDB63_00480 [Nocardioidaceae bacterium]|nr:hypothetical protein [Nocardioidaceae bacterium]